MIIQDVFFLKSIKLLKQIVGFEITRGVSKIHYLDPYFFLDFLHLLLSLKSAKTRFALQELKMLFKQLHKLNL